MQAGQHGRGEAGAILFGSLQQREVASSRPMAFERSYREPARWSIAEIVRMSEAVGHPEPETRPKTLPSEEAVASPERLQGLQKRQQGLLLRGTQFQKPLGYLRGFSLVAADSIIELDRVPVVHQARAQSQSPKGSRPDLVARAQRVA